MDREASTSHHILESLLLDESAEPKSLPLSLLQDITNHFSRRIGSGGCAVVYKGVIGKGMVAVKKLSNTLSIHENKFQEEVKCLIKAKHKNIVRFLGYCADTQGKMENYEGNLVMADHRNWLLSFEYVCNGSLDRHITDATHGFNWRVRYRIIRGICEGLLFLHEKRILHLDLKPANILLDAHMVPKIADFGLSRCLGEEQTRAITQNISGTLGYMDPEYLKTGQMAFASDIYSLGVIIMEILAGSRRYLEDESVVESWVNRLGALEGDIQLEQVRVCSNISIECMDLDPKKRPVARLIIDRLNKTTSVDYSDETGSSTSLVELQESLPMEQSVEERLQNVDVEEDSEILENVAERLGMLDFQEQQQKLGQLQLWGGQDKMEKVHHHGRSNPISTSSGFFELNNLDIFNIKARRNFDRNDKRTLERSHFINIFRKEELRPILRSSNLIGKGGFTEVYKGLVENALVAVKKTSNGDALKNKLLENELIIQSQIIHKNIAWLIGCCLEMDTPILVYEFLPRGSLHEILHSSSKVPLNLDVRLNIVTESAHGLAYLHSQARTKIRHGNFKSASILLDHSFIPKISDFHMSTSNLIPVSELSTAYNLADMTYMDPAYMQTRVLTEKSDVYSFGIVILEVISRKKPTRTDGVWLVQSFIEFHEKGKKATELFDKDIVVTTGDLEILDSLAEIAVECLNLDVNQRPLMIDVAERLLILNRSRRLHARHTSADYSEEIDINNSFVEQQQVSHLSLQGVQDTNRCGATNSSSVSAGIYNLNNLDIFSWKARRNFDRNTRRTLEKSHFIKIFTKEELKPMLRSSNFIGEGAFAVVYRGIIDNALVTVKKPMNDNVRQNKQFENEVLIQSQVVHKNIVRLVGYCLEMDTRMLVYEFLPRGSLHNILHSGWVRLDLDVRLNIISESAHGLAYLHSQAHTKIIHGDVKPASILLDDNFIPKISDFGMSMLTAIEYEHNRYVIGDMAYMDPVYMQTGLLTEGSDVYSFGVVILEVISRKKATRSDKYNLVRSFIEVYKNGKKATELFDKEIAVKGNLEILDYLAEIAVECLNIYDQRPTMTSVAERLLTLQRYHRSRVSRQ